MEELKNIEQYFLRGEYPTGYTKEDKANLCRKCRNNFKLEEGVATPNYHLTLLPVSDRVIT